ncbi:MAG: sulfotransferase family protein [Candidatus Methylomirabilia bacterium]
MTPHHLTGAPIDRILRLLRRNRIRPAALPRLLPLLWVGAWASHWARREESVYGARLRELPAPRDPIIIVGHWRTGSTFLHQLLNLDPRLTAPTMLQCVLPSAFLVAGRYIEPVLRRTLSPTRPMDQVRLAPGEPHEDEFALLRLIEHSPLERLVFPTSSRYFLLDEEPRFIREAEIAAWCDALSGFVKKVGFATGRRVVLKNPFHSVRVSLLESLFPEARFIHIRRDPLAVIPSTQRMWAVLGKSLTLGSWWGPPSMEEIVEVYQRMLTRLERDLAALPAGRRSEVRFEDLEADPVRALRGLYAGLDLTFDQEHETRVRAFLDEVRGYRKNSYSLDPAVASLIRERLGGDPGTSRSRVPVAGKVGSTCG